MITTSRSAVAAFQRCPRLRWHQYEAPNGTLTPGWESRKLAIPLVTGIYVHEGLAQALSGVAPHAAAQAARGAYMAEVSSRGLAIEAGDEKEVIDEQAAHVEALVLAWARVRLPIWQKDFEVVAVEQEDRVALSDDVVLAVRQDAIVRRKADGRMFVLNFKTTSSADERWMRQWETDMQLMTELLAAEQRYGGPFGGMIIEGLVKGARVGVDQWLKEVRGDDAKDKIASYIDRSRLLYGYKCDADPPLTPQQYQWEGTTRKGWYKFRTWKEQFLGAAGHTYPASPEGLGCKNIGELSDAGPQREEGGRELATSANLQYWINWLPEEVVEQCFAVVPPIMRDSARIESCVRQIVSMEQNVRVGVEAVKLDPAMIDEFFFQNGHSCSYPGKCGMYSMCWDAGISDDPTSLYRPRVDHHQQVK